MQIGEEAILRPELRRIEEASCRKEARVARFLEGSVSVWGEYEIQVDIQSYVLQRPVGAKIRVVLRSLLGVYVQSQKTLQLYTREDIRVFT